MVLQHKLMYYALFLGKTRDDLKEMKRDLRTISEKLKSQMTSGEKGTDCICLWRFYFTLRKSETR